MELMECGLININEFGKIFYHCTICTEVSKQAASFLKHLQDHFKQRPIYCHICSKHLDSFGSMVTHVSSGSCSSSSSVKICPSKGQHINEMKANEEPTNTLDSNNAKIINIKMEYEDSDANLEDVLNCIQNEPLEISPKPFPKFQKNNENKLIQKCIKQQNTTTTEQIVCNFCKKTFKYPTALSSHLRKHTGEKPYKCEKCSKAFSASNTLKKHMLIHTDEKPNQCNVCGIRYRFRSGFLTHMRTHTNTRPYKCDRCDKRFFSSTTLTQHLVTHSDKRPFICSECNKGFRRQDALRQHLKLHQGIKEYSCNICNAEFAQLAGLYSHMKGHQIVQG